MKSRTEKPVPSDGALFVTQLHRNIDQPIIHLVSGAKYGGIGAAYIAALAGGATRSLIVGGVAGMTQRFNYLNIRTLVGIACYICWGFWRFCVWCGSNDN